MSISSYFYIAILFIACAYIIIHSIYLFNKGIYIFAKATNKQAVFSFGLSMVISFSLYNLMLNTRPSLFIFQLYCIIFSLCFAFGISVLNYLFYKKNSDHKIIYHTVIFDLCATAFCLWAFYLH